MINRKYIGAAVVGLLAAVVLVAADGTIQTWTGKGSRRSTVEMELRSSSLGSAADLIPGAANANGLGTSSLYWAALYTRSANLAVAVDTTATNVDYAGQIVRTSGYVVYIGTATGGLNWIKVGAQ